MKAPISWLKDFVDIEISPQELADKLVSCGFEIEEIIYQKDKIKNVVTGKIININKHPNADKLLICEIDTAKEKITVITAAQNVKVGDIVPVALDGAQLANGKKIKAGELRGILSQGMMCSGEDLDLTENDYAGAGVYGILILHKDTPLGADINDIIGNDDVILDISVTTNRQDCNSIIGIAREIAAVTDKKFIAPDLSFNKVAESVCDKLSVEVADYNLCHRYMAMGIKDVIIKQSPQIIKKRLKAVGIRPINNIVDVTNYVLIETGQPLHAFDFDLLEGGKIIVRTAEQGEKITALDGKEYALDKDNLLICDINKPVAVAGIMGGEFSSVNQKTKTIALESANFARDSVRRTSRKLNLRSDSSQRFEKGVDFYSQELGLYRALSIIDKYGWGKIMDGVIDKKQAEISNKEIVCDYSEINKVLGISVDKDIIVDILRKLNFSVNLDGNKLTVTIPLYRIDVDGINDLAEEVIRIYGYKHLVPTLLIDTQMVRGGKSAAQKLTDKIKAALIAHGFYETISYSFISPKAFDALRLPNDHALRKTIKLRNPLGEDYSVMRTTLCYSMIKTMASNITRGNKQARFFEFAKTYLPDSLPLSGLPVEEYYLCTGVYGDNEDFYTLKNVWEDIFDTLGIERDYALSDISYLHPGRGAAILGKNGEKIGYIGEVLPDVCKEFDIDKRLYVAEISHKYLIDNAKVVYGYKPISRYQGCERDLALLMPKETPVKDVLNIIRANGTDLLEDCEVFDVYEGSRIPTGLKSVAVNLSFRHLSRTLTDEEINLVIDNILKGLAAINAHLRQA